MNHHIGAFAAAALVAVIPLAAAAQEDDNQAVRISRSAGTCPASIMVKRVSKEYPGGASFDYVAQTMSAAYTASLVSATNQRMVWTAPVRPAYATCAGTGHVGEYTVTLAKGTLTFVFAPVKGESGFPALIDVGVSNGLPHVSTQIPD